LRILNINSNSALVNYLITTGALYSNTIIEAFEHVDRADFVPFAVTSDVYMDYPLQIGYGQTISQPTTVAMMLEMLAPQAGDKILDIGTGSGWTTALLAYIVTEQGLVTGLERIPELVEFGRYNLDKYRFPHAKITQAGDALGVPHDTFDRILVSAAAEDFPNALLRQLKRGGKLVIPVRNSIFEITKKENGEIQSIEHHGFSFVPLINK